MARTVALLGRGGRPAEERPSRGEALAGYGFVAIPLLLFLVLFIGAILFAAYMSLTEWRVRGGAQEFIGLDNYTALLNDRTFHKALYNIATYTLWVVPLQAAIGLLLAVVVNAKIHGQTFFRAAFYFPAIASSAAITVLFIFIMQPAGLFNGFREFLPFDPFEALGYGPRHNWVATASTALGSIMALNIWTTSGTMMLFYLASLQTISREVYEAARIDGANAWQTFWRITFPLLKPAHFFVLTVSVIGALQMFDQAYIGGGGLGEPNFSLMTVVLYVYYAMVNQINFDYAAAIGVVLFAIIFVATLVQRQLFGRTEAA